MFQFLRVQDQAWTSSSSRSAAHGLQEALLTAGGWRDSTHLLMGEEEKGGMVGGILDVLQPQLNK